MKPGLQLRVSQHLALTPQLQQSIRLLQLSTLELHQEVEQMLEQNPFLEAEEELATPWDTPVERTAADSRGDDEAWDGSNGSSTTTSTSDSAPAEGEPAPMDANDFGTPERDDWENGTEAEDFDSIRETPNRNASNDGGDDFDATERSSAGVSLQEHLREQLRGMRLSPTDRVAVMVLIESLDEDGYLADPLEEIAERLAAYGSLDLATDAPTNGHDHDAADDEAEELLDRLRCALKWLQNMEPLGVGARDLSECLVLQLRAGARCEAQMIAILICKHHLELLARRDAKKLMAATGADEELLKAAQALIVRCEPKPGRPFTRAEANIVIPDVIVQKAGRGWRVVLNPDVMPKLRINDLYAQAIKQQRGARTESGIGLSARLQEARWFMKNILQRFDTIQRVSQAIVERQKGFFSHGAIAMKPLVLREIADELGLHESTISRVTTAKYMSTPYGTYELKYFFGSSLNTDAGGNASSTAVRALIKQLVSAEDAKKPLSDSQLSQMLEEQGIQVARRTVAKYREALKIAPANLRREL